MNPDSLFKQTWWYISRLYDLAELLCLTMLDGIGCGRLTIGYYRDRDKFCHDAQELNGKGNIYVNLHRLNPNLCGRVADRYQTWSKQRYTSEEVIWRPRLVIDLDPVRLSGINSTDEELQSAYDLAPRIADYVESEFGESPVIISSGNGVQMVVRIDEPPESKLPEQFLKHLDEKFSNDRVEVDTSCHDLARIVRLPGTLNCKGDHIPERPRRYSLLMERNNAA